MRSHYIRYTLKINKRETYMGSAVTHRKGLLDWPCWILRGGGSWHGGFSGEAWGPWGVYLAKHLKVKCWAERSGLDSKTLVFLFLLFGEESKEAGINRQCSVLLSALSMFSWCFHSSSLARLVYSLQSSNRLDWSFRFLYFLLGSTSTINPISSFRLSLMGLV